MFVVDLYYVLYMLEGKLLISYTYTNSIKNMLWIVFCSVGRTWFCVFLCCLSLDEKEMRYELGPEILKYHTFKRLTFLNCNACVNECKSEQTYWKLQHNNLQDWSIYHTLRPKFLAHGALSVYIRKECLLRGNTIVNFLARIRTKSE